LVSRLNWEREILADEAGLHQVSLGRVEDAIADYIGLGIFVFERL
jgi:hypothetical protein